MMAEIMAAYNGLHRDAPRRAARIWPARRSSRRRRRRRPQSATARRSRPTARSPRPRRRSAASTSSRRADLDEAIELAAQCPGAQLRLDRGPARSGDFDGRPAGASVGAAAGRAPRRRHPRGRRSPVPRGSGTGGRDAHPRPRRLRPRRGGRPGRVRRRRSRPGRPRACRDNPGAWITTTARNRGDRPAAPPPAAAREDRGAGARRGDRGGARGDRTGATGRRRRRHADHRRPAAADLHVLPSGAARWTARVALTLRTLGGLTTPGDRPRVPRPRADARPAARPGQAQDPRRRHPVPRPAAELLPGAARRRPAGPVPRVQRGLRGVVRRRAGPPRAVAPRRSGWPGSWSTLMPDEPEAIGLLALMLLHDARREARASARPATSSCSRTRIASRWDRARIDEGRALVERALARPAGRAVPAAGGDRRAPRRGRTPRARPTGRRSPRCTRPGGGSTPSPVVELNLRGRGGDGRRPRGRARADRRPRCGDGRLDDYPYLHAARADLLRRLGRRSEAAAAYRRALDAHDEPRRARIPRAPAGRGGGSGGLLGERPSRLTSGSLGIGERLRFRGVDASRRRRPSHEPRRRHRRS